MVLRKFDFYYKTLIYIKKAKIGNLIYDGC